MAKFENLFVYYWKTEEITESGNFHTELRFYGIDENGENVCVRVENIQTRCLIEFSDNDYLEKEFNAIKQKLSSIIFNKKDQNSIKLVKKRKLYGSYYENNEIKNGEIKTDYKLFPYIEIYFSSKIGMFSFKKKIKDLDLKCTTKFHETGVTTELQFMVENEIYPSGWVKIKRPIEVEEHEKISTCNKEYFVEKNNVTSSTLTKGVDAKLMSWDIEAKVEDIGKNPGNGIDDCVFQISCVFSTTISKKIKKVLLTLGKCKQFADDVEIRIFKDERDLILGFTQLINEENPNIITGWNIFNFDITFMLNRAERLMILGEFMSFGFKKDTQGEIQTIKWSSKAFSTTNIKYIDVEGILSIDLIEVVRKDFKLDSYSLNNVSKHFLKEEKDDISFKDLMYAYKCFIENNDELEEEFTKIGKYCVQDSKLVVDLFDKLQTWIGLSEMSITTSTPIMNVHLNGQQKKFYNQIYRYCYKQNIVVETDVYKSKSTDRYTGAYVFDPIPGLYEYVVPLDFASLYPSIIIAYNFDYTSYVHENSNLPEETLTIVEWEDHIGCEHDPLVCSKNMLTKMIENCQDKIEKKKLTKERANITKKINKNVMCQKNKFRFLKQEFYGKGVVPTIIQNLLDARKEVRKQMKTVKDPSLLAILNQRQLSYKISANSMYGATGVKSGALPFMPIAMCVTYTGRQSIQKASRILKELGGTIVYGDTDSNYVMFEDIKGNHIEKCKNIWERATNVANEISSHYPKPMRIEFEEVIYYKFMILTKKRYMYYSCTEQGEISKKIGQKGVLLARRDNSKFIKQIYEETVMNVFDGQTKDQVIDNILKNIHNLLTLQTDLNILKINKSVNDYNSCELVFDENLQKWKMGSYIVPEPPMDATDEEKIEFCIKRLPAQVQLEIKMLERGLEKAEGSRLDYIVINQPGAIKQCDKIEQYKYFIQNRQNYKIDYLYYITHLIDPLEQIFDSIYKTEKFVEKSLNIFTSKSKLNSQINKLFEPIFEIEE